MGSRESDVQIGGIMKHLLLTLLSAGLLSSAAWAVPVDPDAADGLAAILGDPEVGGAIQILTTAGDFWNVSLISGELVCTPSEQGIPVSIGEIKDWQWHTVITHDLTVWRWEGSPQASWRYYGPIPCLGPVKAESKSLGGMKSTYR